MAGVSSITRAPVCASADSMGPKRPATAPQFVSSTSNDPFSTRLSPDAIFASTRSCALTASLWASRASRVAWSAVRCAACAALCADAALEIAVSARCFACSAASRASSAFCAACASSSEEVGTHSFDASR